MAQLRACPSHDQQGVCMWLHTYVSERSSPPFQGKAELSTASQGLCRSRPSSHVTLHLHACMHASFKLHEGRHGRRHAGIMHIGRGALVLQP